MPAEELDEAPGVAVEPVGAGVLDAPPVPPTDAEPEAEPEGLDGVVAPLGEEAVLELDEPGAVVVRFGLSASHAASPKARATAAVRMDSFMCPPWVGIKKYRCKLRARPNPLIAKEPAGHVKKGAENITCCRRAPWGSPDASVLRAGSCRSETCPQCRPRPTGSSFRWPKCRRSRLARDRIPRSGRRSGPEQLPLQMPYVSCSPPWGCVLVTGARNGPSRRVHQDRPVHR